MTIEPGKFASANLKFFGDKKHTFFFTLTVMAAAWAGGMPALLAQDVPPPYKNASLTVDARVADLLGRMTIEEKARQLDMYFGCEDLLDKNKDQTIDHHTHAKPDAIFDPQFAEKKLGNIGVGSVHSLYPSAKFYNTMHNLVV